MHVTYQHCRLEIVQDIGGRSVSTDWAEIIGGQELSSERPEPAYPDGLSAREVEVLRLIAAGKSNGEIADALVVSVRTVERHITNIYGKIDARGRADATSYALGHGLARSNMT